MKFNIRDIRTILEINHILEKALSIQNLRKGRLEGACRRLFYIKVYL